MENIEQMIAEAFDRAQSAGVAAEKALLMRDAKQAPAIVFEALTLTLEALTLVARNGGLVSGLGAMENLLPNAVYYVRILQTLRADPFDAIARLKLGSSIGVEDAQ